MNIPPPGLVNPLAVFHNMRSTLGFADGHAEKIVWKDKRTENFSDEVNNGRDAHAGTTDVEELNNEDIRWLRDHYGKK